MGGGVAANSYLRKRLSDDERATLEQGRIADLPHSRVEYAYREMCEDMVYELGFLMFFPQMDATLDELWRVAEMESEAAGGP